MTQQLSYLIVLLSFCGIMCPTAHAADLPLVRDGRSRHKIYHAPDAPTSVKTAAQELQHYIREATGANLAVVTTPVEPMICLGENGPARKAGLSAADIPLEGFRIAVRGMNLYILGPDTPDGGMTPGGGFSNGTLNGVYTFIHDMLNVRWLMPGPYGDDVPKTANVIVEDRDITHDPVFPYRVLNIYSGPVRATHREATQRWLARHRLGGSIRLRHGHAWQQTIPASLFKDHPDYFAMTAGERIDPVNGPSGELFKKNPALAQHLLSLVKHGRYKLCITNPGLVRAYADAVIGSFDRHPQDRAYSLSPTDSARFCECPACSALYEKDPHGNLSITPAILQFYNGVAERVARRHPDRLVCGYVYASYLYPPKDKSWRPQPNLVLVAAISKLTYGVGLFRPGMTEEFDAILKEWRTITTNLAYYDMCGVLEQFHGKSKAFGAPNPPSIAVLKFVFPRLKLTCSKGVFITGGCAWGQIGLLNYLLANLIWDPDADVDALFNEYCDRAYGKGSLYMKKLYLLVDQAISDHCRTKPGARYVLTEGMVRDVYAANYNDIEALFLKAQSAAETPAQKYRLDMVRKNLVFLNWCLRRANLLEDDPKSPLRLSDEELRELYESEESALALYPMKATWQQLQKRFPRAVVRPRYSAKLPKYWHFQPDPKDEGVAQDWFKPDFDVSKWNRIGINDTWEDQGYGPPAYPQKGGYNGYAWYRANGVKVPKKYHGWKAFIYFGAVDESCRVYVNGKRVAGFEYDAVKNPDSWEQPLELSLGNSLRYGEENIIAIRVHDSGGAGGIWRGAFLLFRKPG